MRIKFGYIVESDRLRAILSLMFVASALGCDIAQPRPAGGTPSTHRERWSAVVVTAALADGSLETFRASPQGLSRGAALKAPKKGAFVEDIAVSSGDRRAFVLCAPGPRRRVVRVYEVADDGTLKLIRETQVQGAARAMAVSPTGRALALIAPGLVAQVYRVEADGRLTSSDLAPSAFGPSERTSVEVSASPGDERFFALYGTSGLDSSETFVGAFEWTHDEKSVRPISTPLHTNFEEEPLYEVLALRNGTALLARSNGISRLSVVSRRLSVSPVARGASFETGFALADGSALLLDGSGKAVRWPPSRAATAIRSFGTFPGVVMPALRTWVSPNGENAIVVSGADRGFVGLYRDPFGSPRLIGQGLASSLTGGTVKAVVMPLTRS